MLRPMRARLAPLALVLCLATAGCSDDGGAAGPTLPPLTESPSASPSPRAVAVPSEATAATPEGAAEFARFFYAQVARGFQAADPSLVDAISGDDCATCNNYIESITAVRDEKLRAEGGDFELYLAVSPALEGDTATVDVGWNFASVRYFDASGNLVQEGPAMSGVEESVTLRRESDTWIVQDIRRIRQRS